MGSVDPTLSLFGWICETLCKDLAEAEVKGYLRKSKGKYNFREQLTTAGSVKWCSFGTIALEPPLSSHPQNTSLQLGYIRSLAPASESIMQLNATRNYNTSSHSPMA
jgi:hypothetical protein